MKNSYNRLLATLLLLCVGFTSCNAGELNTKAEAAATSFYKDLQKKDYAQALMLCSSRAFSSDPKESWKKDFEKNAVLLGNLVSFTKTSGFNIATSTTTGTTVTIAYEVKWQYGKSRDSLILIKEKDGNMKVFGYRWQHMEAQYLTGITASEKKVTEYMNDIKAKQYDNAIALCSPAALKATPKEQWKSFFEKAASRYGSIAGYQILSDSSFYNIAATGESGKGNYYDIYVRTKRNDQEVLEKLVFFQKTYEEPVMLAGHFFL